MLDIQRISKTFNPGTVNEKKAITDLSLHLNKGEFVTVIGSNGAGKSTLFNAIAGSFYVDDGAITVGGHDMTFLPEYKRAKRIGRLFQDPLKGTAPNMTIEENLALAAGNGSWFSRLTQKDRARFRDRLALLDMGLEDRLNQPVGLLSGGQRQALTLLMATMNPPLAPASGRAYRRPGPRHSGKGTGADEADRGGGEHHLSDGNAQHAAGFGTGNPDIDDG